MTQGNYVSEDTNSLIRRARQTLGETPVLDLRNWQVTTYKSTGNMMSLAGSCHSIKVKNIISVVDSSIVTCTDATTANCVAIPAGCGDIEPTTPDLYYNMVATVSAAAAQTGVEITFKYVLDGVPTTAIVLADLDGVANNTVYAFATNALYPSGTELVLYGAEATNY